MSIVPIMSPELEASEVSGSAPLCSDDFRLLAHPAQIMPVMGSNNLERIADFSAAYKVEMDRQSWFELYSTALGHEVP